MPQGNNNLNSLPISPPQAGSNIVQPAGLPDGVQVKPLDAATMNMLRGMRQPVRRNTPAQRYPSMQRTAPVQQAQQRMPFQQAMQQGMPFQQTAQAQQRMPFQQTAQAQQRIPFQQAMPMQQGMPFQQAMPVQQGIPFQQPIPAAQQTMPTAQQTMPAQQAEQPARQTEPAQQAAPKNPKESKLYKNSRFTVSLRELIQDEHNSSRFYAYLSEIAPNTSYADYFKREGDICGERVNKLNSLHKQFSTGLFSPDDTDINTQIPFQAGVSWAAAVESNALEKFGEMYENAPDERSARSVLTHVCEKLKHTLILFLIMQNKEIVV